MSPLTDCWASLQRLVATLASHYTADFRAAVLAQGLGREPVGILLLAANVDPPAVSAMSLLACLPYYAETAFSRRLDRLVVGGWLARQGGGYGLTPHGRTVVDALQTPVRARLAGLAPMPPADLERMARLLERLFLACRASLDVAALGCVATSGNGGQFPDPDASPLSRTGRAVEALSNFRCDVHRAAWRPLNVSGPAWEALTWLLTGIAESPETLRAWAEKQPFPRGWSAADYAGFLDELVNRGWVEAGQGESWQATQVGRQVRETAEAETEKEFYEPWLVLTSAEVGELAQRAELVTQALTKQEA